MWKGASVSAGASVLLALALSAEGRVQGQTEVRRLGVRRGTDLDHDWGRLLGLQGVLGDETVRLGFKDDILTVDLDDDGAIALGHGLAGGVGEGDRGLTVRLDHELRAQSGRLQPATRLDVGRRLGGLGGDEHTDREQGEDEYFHDWVVLGVGEEGERASTQS